MLLQIIGFIFYANIISLNYYSEIRVCYTLVDYLRRSIFEFNVFASVTLYWFRSTETARTGVSEQTLIFQICPGLLILTSIILTFHSIEEAVDLNVPTNTYSSLQKIKAHSIIHRHQLLIEAFAWSLQAILFIISATIMYWRISNLPIYSDIKFIDRTLIICQIILPQGYCEFAYILRAAVMSGI